MVHRHLLAFAIHGLAVVAAFSWPDPARGQESGAIRHLSFGGERGESWPERNSLNVLVDDTTVPGALQPLELRPDENFVPALFSRYPFERRVNTANPLWVEGMPRMWRSFGIIGNRESSVEASYIYVDGDHTTFTSRVNYNSSYMSSEFYTIDTGGTLPMQRFALQLPPPEFTDQFGEPYRNYVPLNGELSGSELGAQLLDEFTIADEVTSEFGTFRTGELYDPLDSFLGSVQQNLDAPIVFDFPRHYLRYVRWRTFPDSPDAGTILKLAYADFELFGDGFAGVARYETEPVDLGATSIVGRVELGVSRWQRQGAGWVERSSPGGGRPATREWAPGRLVPVEAADGRLIVRIKSGTAPDPKKYFTYGDFGQLVETDYATWESLRLRKTRQQPRYVGWRGPVIDDRERWTPWSGEIAASGVRPALRSGRYLKIQVEMTSRHPREAVRLDSLRIEIVPLLASTLIGEVGLVDDGTAAGDPQTHLRDQTLATLPIGEPVDLVYAIRAEFAGGRGAGFDAVHIEMPSAPEYLSLHRGDPPRQWDPAEVRPDPTGLTLFLAEPVAGDESLRIGLRTSLYTLSQQLPGEVFDRGNDQVRQQIDPGDAADDIHTNQLLLIARDSIDEAIGGLSLEPAIITPNGDGSNDQTLIRFTLFGVFDAQVEITFYDLGGTRVRRLALTGQRAGVTNQPAAWDGRDEGGSTVPPGLYLCRVETKTSRGREALTSPVAVVY